jgi:hypothetical protein
MNVTLINVISDPCAEEVFELIFKESLKYMQAERHCVYYYHVAIYLNHLFEKDLGKNTVPYIWYVVFQNDDVYISNQIGIEDVLPHIYYKKLWKLEFDDEYTLRIYEHIGLPLE